MKSKKITVNSFQIILLSMRLMMWCYNMIMTDEVLNWLKKRRHEDSTVISDTSEKKLKLSSQTDSNLFIDQISNNSRKRLILCSWQQLIFTFLLQFYVTNIMLTSWWFQRNLLLQSLISSIKRTSTLSQNQLQLSLLKTEASLLQ